MSSALDSFMTKVQLSRQKVPKNLTAKINEIARKAIKENGIARKAIEDMSKEAGNFLNKELDDDKHTEEQVKAIIELFPDSLKQEDECDDSYLPIFGAAASGGSSAYLLDSAVAHSSVAFVPLMAREGCRLGVGGEGNRGGLLSVMPIDEDDVNDDDNNTIECLSCSIFRGENGPAADEHDRKRAQVLEKLREWNLLKKDDIEEYGLLSKALQPKCKHRFEFFSTWDPDALEARDSQWVAPIHGAIEFTEPEDREETFEIVLKAGMEHFPERLGFLFLKLVGITACKRAFDNFGIEKAMQIIRRCIPPSENHLILHHAHKNAPELVNDIGACLLP